MKVDTVIIRIKPIKNPTVIYFRAEQDSGAEQCSYRMVQLYTLQFSAVCFIMVQGSGLQYGSLVCTTGGHSAVYYSTVQCCEFRKGYMD